MSVDFSWKTSAKKYQQLYDDLIGKTNQIIELKNKKSCYLR